MLNYHHIWLSYAISIETTPRFVTRKFYACIIDCSVFGRQQKTAYRLKSNEATVVSINLTDKLVILVIFVNNEHFANALTVWKVSYADQMRMQTLRGQGFGAI